MAFPSHVLVSPLNWGLGHASRCIPIIHYFLKKASKVSIASDGNALQLLKEEFSELDVLELHSTNVRYSTFGFYFYLKLIVQGFGHQKRALKDEDLVKAYFKKNSKLQIFKKSDFILDLIQKRFVGFHFQDFFGLWKGK